MFTGIINAIGTIESAEARGDLKIVVACDWKDLRVGESIAVNGACLTVTEVTKNGFAVDVSKETESRTAPRWKKNERVNLERALKLGDALDGHLVTGHVDGVTKIREIAAVGGSRVIEFEAPQELSRFIAEKGSVALDGVSLTVNKVEGARFSVNIIPHTWSATIFSDRKAGDFVNLEIDLIARYAARLLEQAA